MFSDRAFSGTRCSGLIHESRGDRMAPRRWLMTFFERLLEQLKLRVGGRPSERSLRIEERLMVGGRKSVLLVACGGRRFLLASSGDALTPLFEVQPAEGQPAADMPLAQIEESRR